MIGGRWVGGPVNVQLVELMTLGVPARSLTPEIVKVCVPSGVNGSTISRTVVKSGCNTAE
jgi:hypothetical protein